MDTKQTSIAASLRGVALITGAGRRVGYAIALRLAQEGWDIAIHYHRSEQEALAVAAEIRSLGRRAVALKADLSDEAQAMALIPRCIVEIGLPTCLVNNASQFQYDLASTFNYASFDASMRTNAGAPILLARELYRVTPADGRAVVINLLDQKLFNLNPDFFSYTLSKAALQTATTLLAQALAPRLRVVGIAPGITLASGQQSQISFANAHKMTPLGQSSTPQDIAQAVCFLATAQAITGTTLLVDGGQHLLPSHRDVMFLTE
ncbi:MAG: SDR family oxidoreductase [Ottowia sp.]|nr:SDR family oxidoreductase [Ottowia sp.]